MAAFHELASLSPLIALFRALKRKPRAGDFVPLSRSQHSATRVFHLKIVNKRVKRIPAFLLKNILEKTGA